MNKIKKYLNKPCLPNTKDWYIALAIGFGFDALVIYLDWRI